MPTKNQTGLAGEFLVLSELFFQGFEASFTLGNAKSVDILAMDPDSKKILRIEAKTTRHKYKTSVQTKSPWGSNIEWPMNKRHESITDPNLFYCFVYRPEDAHARFFVVPSKTVAQYVKAEYRFWKKIPRKGSVNDTDMRTFRIALNQGAHGLKAKKYEDRWDYLRK